LVECAVLKGPCYAVADLPIRFGDNLKHIGQIGEPDRAHRPHLIKAICFNQERAFMSLSDYSDYPSGTWLTTLGNVLDVVQCCDGARSVVGRVRPKKQCTCSVKVMI
jgi:hypothetical protein